jgi:CRISPR-associated protein Csd1
MILQSLKEYYDRNPDLPPPGWINQKLDFAIVLKSNGDFQQLECLQDVKKNKRIPMPRLVPNIGKQALKHTNSGTDANLLWDNSGFVLGVGKKGALKLESFYNALKEWFPDSNDQGILAVQTFIRNGLKNDAVFSPIINHDEYGQEIQSGKPAITFRLLGDESFFIFERQAVREKLSESDKIEASDEAQGVCLITGMKNQSIDKCHTVIKGVWGAQKSGATIVGFNSPSFCSYNKDQGANAPTGKTAVFAYTTALNHLLTKDSRQRMQVGDASTVFWAEKPCYFEDQLPDFFGEPPKDDPDRGVRAVESLFKSIDTGALVSDENQNNRFYVLGLSPNASRIAIRFWIVNTVAGMSDKIKQHFDDLRMVHGPKDRDVFSLFRMLVSTAALGKAENISPNLAGETMRSILEGLPYPQTLLQAAIRRIRAEHEITYYRAALIKACINRSTRFKNPDIKEELQMSLDESNTNIGYRLGRLFASLERIQIRKFTQNGGKEPNSTIRDKYYGAASGTPASVFGTLIRLSKHHLASIDNVGERINFEKLIGEIMNDISDFPTHLKLEDQGRFAIGYYHQMQNFFTKKIDNNEQPTE